MSCNSSEASWIIKKVPDDLYDDRTEDDDNGVDGPPPVVCQETTQFMEPEALPTEWVNELPFQSSQVHSGSWSSYRGEYDHLIEFNSKKNKFEIQQHCRWYCYADGDLQRWGSFAIRCRLCRNAKRKHMEFDRQHESLEQHRQKMAERVNMQRHTIDLMRDPIRHPDDGTWLPARGVQPKWHTLEGRYPMINTAAASTSTSCSQGSQQEPATSHLARCFDPARPFVHAPWLMVIRVPDQVYTCSMVPTLRCLHCGPGGDVVFNEDLFHKALRANLSVSAASHILTELDHGLLKPRTHTKKRWIYTDEGAMDREATAEREKVEQEREQWIQKDPLFYRVKVVAPPQVPLQTANLGVGRSSSSLSAGDPRVAAAPTSQDLADGGVHVVDQGQITSPDLDVYAVVDKDGRAMTRADRDEERRLVDRERRRRAKESRRTERREERKNSKLMLLSEAGADDLDPSNSCQRSSASSKQNKKHSKIGKDKDRRNKHGSWEEEDSLLQYVEDKMSSKTEQKRRKHHKYIVASSSESEGERRSLRGSATASRYGRMSSSRREDKGFPLDPDAAKLTTKRTAQPAQWNNAEKTPAVVARDHLTKSNDDLWDFSDSDTMEDPKNSMSSERITSNFFDTTIDNMKSKTENIDTTFDDYVTRGCKAWNSDIRS
ncbi:unnamed protein product [Amoebophrya sp. A120]|nr:unnamed protein product [Amoebophrya sp. A120]|eukprot:GSA120T00004097001.1